MDGQATFQFTNEFDRYNTNLTCRDGNFDKKGFVLVSWLPNFPSKNKKNILWLWISKCASLRESTTILGWNRNVGLSVADENVTRLCQPEHTNCHIHTYNRFPRWQHWIHKVKRKQVASLFDKPPVQFCYAPKKRKLEQKIDL